MGAQRGTGAPYGGQGSAPFAGGGSSGPERFFQRTTLGAAGTSLVITGLDGDTDKCYRIRGYGPVNSEAGCTVNFNGVAVNGSAQTQVYAALSPVAGQLPAAFRVLQLMGRIGGGRVTGTYFEMMIDCVRQANKMQMCWVKSCGYSGGAGLHAFYIGSLDVTLAGNLTGVTITAAVANAFAAGFVVEILGDTDA